MPPAATLESLGPPATKALPGALTAGKLDADGKLPNIAIASLEDLKNEFLTKQKALNDNITPLVARARQLIEPHLKTIYDAILREAIFMESAERELTTRLTIPDYVPSHPLRCAFTLMMQLNSWNLTGEVFPEKMLLKLGIEL